MRTKLAERGRSHDCPKARPWQTDNDRFQRIEGTRPGRYRRSARPKPSRFTASRKAAALLSPFQTRSGNPGIVDARSAVKPDSRAACNRAYSKRPDMLSRPRFFGSAPSRASAAALFRASDCEKVRELAVRSSSPCELGFSASLRRWSSARAK